MTDIHSIAIADNDVFLSEKINSNAYWNGMGFNLVGYVKDRKSAAELVSRKKPEILMINLKFLEGEVDSFIERIRSISPFTQIVFIVENENIGYLKELSAYDNVSFIIKSQLLRKIIESNYRTVLDDEDAVIRQQNKALAAMSLLVNDGEQNMSREELEIFLNSHGIRFTPESRMAVVVIRASMYTALPDEAYRIADEVIGNVYQGGCFNVGNRIMALLVSEDGFRQLNSVLDEVYSTVSHFLKSDLIIGVSSIASTAAELFGASIEALNVIKMSESSGIHYASNEDIKKKLHTDMDFDSLLVTGDEKDIVEYLSYHLKPDGADLEVLQVFMTAYKVFSFSLGKEKLAEMLYKYGLVNPITENTNMKQFKEKIMYFIMNGHSLLNARKHNDMDDLISKVKTAVERRYMDPELTLNSLSSYLHVTPNYLSAQIRKHEGVTFKELLISKRMEKAKDYLQESMLPVSEVAEKCGYTDRHYFSYCFKKFYGVSPLQMKQKNTEK